MKIAIRFDCQSDVQITDIQFVLSNSSRHMITSAGRRYYNIFIISTNFSTIVAE